METCFATFPDNGNLFRPFFQAMETCFQLPRNFRDSQDSRFPLLPERKEQENRTCPHNSDGVELNQAMKSSFSFPTVLATAGGLVLVAAMLGLAANLFRHPPLPLAYDWSHHVETLAHEAGIPVVFLPEVKSIVAANADADAPVVLLDARAETEFAEAHLPGAISLPPEAIDARLPALPFASAPDAPIVTYCSGMDCDDALVLAQALANRAFSNVRLYSGGFAEWVEYGGATEPPAPASAEGVAP